jgi:hypothetical protein
LSLPLRKAKRRGIHSKAGTVSPSRDRDPPNLHLLLPRSSLAQGGRSSLLFILILIYLKIRKRRGACAGRSKWRFVPLDRDPSLAQREWSSTLPWLWNGASDCLGSPPFKARSTLAPKRATASLATLPLDRGRDPGVASPHSGIHSKAGTPRSKGRLRREGATLLGFALLLLLLLLLACARDRITFIIKNKNNKKSRVLLLRDPLRWRLAQGKGGRIIISIYLNLNK